MAVSEDGMHKGGGTLRYCNLGSKIGCFGITITGLSYRLLDPGLWLSLRLTRRL